MIFLLDTNVMSDLMREHRTVSSHLSKSSSTDRIVTCPIVRGEILHGLARLPHGKRREALEAKANSLFAVIPCEPLTVSAADHYARIKLNQQQVGLSLDENDLWIAAAASALGATLVSRDKDAMRIQALSVVDWTV